MPHDMLGYSCNVKLVQASECDKGLKLKQSTQLYPFLHISCMCFVPREAGPNHTPSIREAVVGGSVGIGALVLSGRGTVM